MEILIFQRENLTSPVSYTHLDVYKRQVIDPLLFNGYSTISLGYAGLCECVRYMKGVSHLSLIHI